MSAVAFNMKTMFDSGPGGPDAATTLSLVAQTHRAVQKQECQLLELAAHWADLNHPDSQAPAAKTLPGAEQGRQLGGQAPRRCWNSPPPNWAPAWKPASGRREP